ncbi:MAG: isopentenyl-diphosphate delta-isomerase [Bacteroidetes bacterium]|nr:isopentenyl-diphosphate delta-isomerase [Bacteroidota bacterium]
MEDRKGDHISLALNSQTTHNKPDPRFDYEPMLGSEECGELLPFQFLNRQMNVPLWISSMTGGAPESRLINQNLARACKQFGIGMGLGSCRILLDNKKHLPDFDVRKIIGNDLPLWSNIGIAQLEKMMKSGEYTQLTDLVNQLQADGLIIHVNPSQESLQEEGDVLYQRPIDTLNDFLSKTNLKIIVKEVGQGMGPRSVKELLQLPIEAIETASYGGTNFSRLELSRRIFGNASLLEPLVFIGHTAEDMVDTINDYIENGLDVKCKQLIISGGIQSFLDGYYLISKSKLPAVYGQASGFLRHACESYESLENYIEAQILGLRFAKAWLRPKF